jgi:hypothetical protein
MIYKPENSLDIGAEEYGTLCAQDYIAVALARLLEGTIEDSGWTRPMTEHPMWPYITKARENQQKLSDLRHMESERRRQHFSSM